MQKEAEMVSSVEYLFKGSINSLVNQTFIPLHVQVARERMEQVHPLYTLNQGAGV